MDLVVCDGWSNYGPLPNPLACLVIVVVFLSLYIVYSYYRRKEQREAQK
jgi:hypothetical protein